MPNLPIPEGRRSKRILAKTRASLVVNLDRNQKRLPCLVLDSSKEGFRLRSNFHLRRGQVVEIVLDEAPQPPLSTRLFRFLTYQNEQAVVGRASAWQGLTSRSLAPRARGYPWTSK